MKDYKMPIFWIKLSFITSTIIYAKVDKCSSNMDCANTSFCCSSPKSKIGECQAGSFCMMGVKED